MKLKKAIKVMAAFTAIAAGIGTAVYLIKDKLNCNNLDDDFDDDFEDDFDDFEDEDTDDNTQTTREYVNIPTPSVSEEPETDEAETPVSAPVEEASEEAPAETAKEEVPVPADAE